MIKSYEPDGEGTLVTAESVTKNISDMHIPLPMEEFEQAYKRFEGGEHIQDSFPSLSSEEREFILTGVTAEEWDMMFKEEDE